MAGDIFCDLQKAFDCVNHNILSTKLEFYGIAGTPYKLIKSYLEGRYQRVVLIILLLIPVLIEWYKTRGPSRIITWSTAFFLIYINDLPKILNDNSRIVLLQTTLV